MAQAKYDLIADWYHATVRAPSVVDDLILQPVLDLLGDTKGQTICDLACGQGRIARRLAQRGAMIIGVDISQNLIKIAKQEESTHPLGITYHIDDATILATQADAIFDQVICYLALMDISDLGATLKTVKRILKPDGLFTFSITHPCFQTPQASTITKADNRLVREVGNYFEERYWRSRDSTGVRGKVGAYHRTLATYLNGLIVNNLQITQIAEPQPTASLTERRPEYAVVPPFMIIQAQKVSKL